MNAMAFVRALRNTGSFNLANLALKKVVPTLEKTASNGFWKTSSAI